MFWYSQESVTSIAFSPVTTDLQNGGWGHCYVTVAGVPGQCDF